MITIGTHRVSTLCFHGVGTPGRVLEPGEERFWISESRFTEMLDLLAGHRQVEITFDDSNESDHRLALPQLQQRGLAATFFVIAGRVDTAGSLSSAQLVELAAAGMSIGSHGMDHVSWRSLTTAADRHREFTEAAVRIEGVTGAKVRRVACPNGQYDRRVLAGLRAHGYERVYTVDGGASWSSAWVRDRYTITCHDTTESLAEYLTAPDGALRTRAARTARGVIKRWR
ncbi:polysaccharide deacetylase family protein [Microlunatus elymi]|nr:polysaccharide deacetylase family protein [Microlunatus elymi]